MEVLVELELQMPHAGALTPTSFTVAADLSEDDWRKAGLILAREANSRTWWLGDWWAYGERKYGDRKAVVTSPEWCGPTFQTCAHAGKVARKFETCRRRQVLSFSHHEVVAHLPIELADELLERAVRENVRTRELKKWARELRPSASSNPPIVGSEAMRLQMEAMCDAKKASTTSRFRAMRMVALDPSTAQRVLDGDLTFTRGYEIASTIAKQRTEAEQAQRAAYAAALKPARPTNVVQFPETQSGIDELKLDMACKLVESIDLLTTVSRCKVAPYLLKECMTDEESRRIGYEVQECMRFLKYVRDTWAHRDGMTK